MISLSAVYSFFKCNINNFTSIINTICWIMFRKIKWNYFNSRLLTTCFQSIGSFCIRVILAPNLGSVFSWIFIVVQFFFMLLYFIMKFFFLLQICIFYYWKENIFKLLIDENYQDEFKKHIQKVIYINTINHMKEIL